MILVGSSSLLPGVLEVGPAPPPVDALEYLPAYVWAGARKVGRRAVGRAVRQEIWVGSVRIVVVMLSRRLYHAVDGDQRTQGRTTSAEPRQRLALGGRTIGQGQGEVAHLMDLVVDLVQMTQWFLCKFKKGL